MFFDRSPMRPNQDLLSLVDQDDPCRQAPVCPDAQWLENHGPIYVTAEPGLQVSTLPNLRPNDRSEDRHLLTLVLLDERGRRVGESTFIREFIIER
jgi:hypothetical protein